MGGNMFGNQGGGGGQQPAYSANNFIGPQIQSSYNLRQQAQNDPASTLGAFSPAAFQQMLSNFYPSNMTRPNDPSVGGPSSGANVLSPFNAPPGQAPGTQPAQPAAPAAPAAPSQPQGQPGGIFVPQWGQYIYPGQMQQYTQPNQPMPPEIQQAIGGYLDNLSQSQSQQQIADSKDPWSSLMWQYNTKG